MLLLTLSLLATTYAQSVEYSQYKPQQARVLPSDVPAMPPMVAPIDLTDEIYSHDFWSNPNAQNIIYNFEHIRQDQPPHVEARKESLGRYLHRPKPSTTTPAPQNVKPANIQAQITDVHWYQNQQALKSRVPTSTAASLPEWQDTYEQDQQLYSQHRSWSPEHEQAYLPTQPPHIPTQPPYVRTEAPRAPSYSPISQWSDYSYTSTPKPRTWSDPILGNGYKPDHLNPKPTAAPLIPKYSEQAHVEYTAMPRFLEQAPVEITTRAPIVPSTAPVAPVWEGPKYPSAYRQYGPRNGAGRGSHAGRGSRAGRGSHARRGSQKYNWFEDVNTESAVGPSSRGRVARMDNDLLKHPSSPYCTFYQVFN